MGMPALAYRRWHGAYSLRGLERSVLCFTGIGPVRHTLFGMVATASDAKRKGWIARVRELGRRAA